MLKGTIVIPADAPPWLSNVIQNLINYVQNQNAGPQSLTTYVKANLPDAARFYNCFIAVSDDTGGDTPAFSDGTNWRRTADRNIIS